VRAFSTLAILVLADVLLAQPVLITSPATIGPLDTMITPSAGGAAVPLDTAEITVSGTTLTINGRHSIESLDVVAGGIVNHSNAFELDYAGDGTDVVFGASISASSVFIDGSSAISVSGRGNQSPNNFSLPGTGPGGGGIPSDVNATNAAGGGYGGRGGNNNCCGFPAAGGISYGSLTQPTDLGSSAGSRGGDGGGAVRLSVAGTLTIDGAIRANGQNATPGQGGGSGGSIWIDAVTLNGIGTITANGGNGVLGANGAAGGGGGRIAIYASSMTLNASSITAYGGSPTQGQQRGGAGTVFIWEGLIDPKVIIDNGVSSSGHAETVLFNSTGFPVGAELLVTSGARIHSRIPLVVDQLDLIDASSITHNFGDLNGLKITANGVFIDATSAIDVTGRGYQSPNNFSLPGTGPGGGGIPSDLNATNSAGGGYGGRGGNNNCCGFPAAGGRYNRISLIAS